MFSIMTMVTVRALISWYIPIRWNVVFNSKEAGDTSRLFSMHPVSSQNGRVVSGALVETLNIWYANVNKMAVGLLAFRFSFSYWYNSFVSF